MTKPICMIQDYCLLSRMLNAEDSSSKKSRAKWGTRNWFYAAHDTDEWASLLRLEEAGFTTNTGRLDERGQLVRWKATIKGCMWVGLSSAQMRTAMGL